MTGTQRRREPPLPADPCARLELLEQAAYDLAAGGKRRTRVRHGDYEVEYTLGSITYLEREIARLRAICGKRSAITIGRSEPSQTLRRHR
jgi:hypothetical protein